MDALSLLVGFSLGAAAVFGIVLTVIAVANPTSRRLPKVVPDDDDFAEPAKLHVEELKQRNRTMWD